MGYVKSRSDKTGYRVGKSFIFGSGHLTGLGTYLLTYLILFVPKWNIGPQLARAT